MLLTCLEIYIYLLPIWSTLCKFFIENWFAFSISFDLFGRIEAIFVAIFHSFRIKRCFFFVSFFLLGLILGAF